MCLDRTLCVFESRLPRCQASYSMDCRRIGRTLADLGSEVDSDHLGASAISMSKHPILSRPGRSVLVWSRPRWG